MMEITIGTFILGGLATAVAFVVGGLTFLMFFFALLSFVVAAPRSRR